MKKLGIIGGLGPMATVLIMKMIIEMTDAKSDQENIEMVVYNCPQIPDRTKYILGESKENPEPEILRLGKKLEEEGAELIAIPCVTANYFYADLSEKINVPIIDIMKEVRMYLEKHGILRVGLMATSGTVKAGLFQQALSPDFEVIIPGEQEQKDIMHIIYDNVKANQPVDMEKFNSAAECLRNAGAEVIILGCTELSVVRENCDIGKGYLDVMQLMAKRAVEYCGKLNNEYL